MTRSMPNRCVSILVCVFAACQLTPWSGAGFSIRPDAPNSIEFTPCRARFVRLSILQSTRGEPCIDELEVFGPDGKDNLALASRGAKATASSCLAGYAIHRIEHLNDGRYGNEHSWIAATARDEWAQIELPAAIDVAKVVISRDRGGQFTDRVPVHLRVQISLDGRRWQVARELRATAPAASPRAPTPVAQIPFPDPATPEALVRYAFRCEAAAYRAATPNGETAVDRALKQFAALVERLDRQRVDASRERREMAELQQQRDRLKAPPVGIGDNAEETLYLTVREAKRRAFFRDPALASLGRILFVKRHAFEPSHNYSVLLDGQFRPGGGIYVLEIPKTGDRLTPEQATLRCLCQAGGGMARTPMADFAARQVYFSYRASADDYYRIMTVGTDGNGLRQLTAGRPYHDFWPCPLPDGGVAFVSTRCRCRFLCWRPQTFVLFRMDADGSGVRPLSYANLSEWAPSVMRDGRIIWTRSEYQDKGADFGHSLWAIHPDGTHPELLFGNNTTHAYMNGRGVPGTGALVATLACHAGDLNGPLGWLEPRLGRFSEDSVRSLTPDVRPPVGMDGHWPRNHCFRDPVPISSDHILCSHSPQDSFGLYVVDRFGNRELLYLDAAIGSMCPTPLRAVPTPPVLSSSLSAKGSAPDTGEFFVADVYQGLGPGVARGRVKYLRVCEEVRAGLDLLPSGEYRADHQPFQDFYATPIHKVHGPHGWPSYVAKASLGLVPVETDGSVRFTAPAGKVLYFELLDGEYNEIQRMRSVVQLQPGEQRSCVGCHEDRRQAPTVTARARAARRRLPRALEPPPWGAGPFGYEAVVQPVWDGKCVSCHDRQDKQGVNLTAATDPAGVPASYRTLIEKGLVHHFSWVYGTRPRRAAPLSFGVVKSRLWEVLNAGHYKVRLTTDEMRRVKCWIDLNCPLWPDYNYRPDRPAVAGIAAARSR